VTSRSRTVAALALAAGAGACGGDPPPAPRGPQSPPPAAAAPAPAGPRFVFRDVAKAAGIDAVAWCGRKEKPHLLESAGCGLALLDYDGDGRLDAYVVTAWRMDGRTVVERTRNRLYRNRGDGTFEDVTDRAGVGDDGWGQAVAVGDVDSDGRPDLFVSNFGPDVLYRNRGDGTFEAVADPPGIHAAWSGGAVFFDADGDGDDDLFVCGYVDHTWEEFLDAQPTLDWKDRKVMMGPFGLEGLANRFFRNDGGKFTEATDAAGLTDVGEYFSFTAAASDLDDDGDLDLYVANDSNPNYVYRNRGDGTFEEVGLWCGAGLSGAGAAQAGMGVAIGDYDGDLRPDVLVTNFAEDASTLYHNLGRGLFRDVSATTGVRDATFLPLSWGTVFADFDLDADEDIFVANGHIYPQADEPGTNTSFRQRNLLLENVREGGAAKFRDATAGAGPGLEVVEASHGVAAGDVDDDGDVDLLVSNVDAPVNLLRNDSPRDGRHWLVVDAPRARKVVVEAGGRSQVRFRVRGGSFCSESDPRFHFGLGDAAAATVTVHWSGGGETVLRGVPADRAVRPESRR
jgi:hypothetical protein